jgi:hypothetical protein
VSRGRVYVTQRGGQACQVPKSVSPCLHPTLTTRPSMRPSVRFSQTEA